MVDGEPDKGIMPCDNDSLPERLRLVQQFKDYLVTAFTPVKGRSLAEVLRAPPLFLADPATAFSTHEGAAKAKKVVETTPRKKDTNKEPTQSPGGDAAIENQIKPLQAQQWQLMLEAAGALIRQKLGNGNAVALADLTGIPTSDPKQMLFALSGLISEDPAEQQEEIMDEVNDLTLADPLDFNTMWADISAMKNFLDNIPGVKVNKKKWAKLLERKFQRAFPDIKQVSKMRKFNKVKALKAEEIVQLAKMGYNEARRAHRCKRKKMKQQQVMIQKLDMQAKRYRQDGSGNGFNKFGFSGHDYAGEPEFGNQCGPGGYGWNRQSPQIAAVATGPTRPSGAPAMPACTACQALLKSDNLEPKMRNRLMRSICKHTIETCIHPGGKMEGATIEQAWAKSDEIKRQGRLALKTEANQVQFEGIEPRDMANDIWKQVRMGLDDQIDHSEVNFTS
jgi:hypothetical protein